MNYKQAQSLIYSLTGHISQLIFSYTREDGTIEGQITTGNPLAPIVAVNSSNVCESDLIEAIETEEFSVSHSSPHTDSLNLDVWGEFTLIPS